VTATFYKKSSIRKYLCDDSSPLADHLVNRPTQVALDSIEVDVDGYSYKLAEYIKMVREMERERVKAEAI
jgi:hypothetical protein